MKRRNHRSIRNAARSTRRDLRILFGLTVLVIVIFLALQPGRGAGAAQQQGAEDQRLREFDPSEEISADRAIAFPVDI